MPQSTHHITQTNVRWKSYLAVLESLLYPTILAALPGIGCAPPYTLLQQVGLKQLHVHVLQAQKQIVQLQHELECSSIKVCLHKQYKPMTAARLQHGRCDSFTFIRPKLQ